MERRLEHSHEPEASTGTVRVWPSHVGLGSERDADHVFESQQRLYASRLAGRRAICGDFDSISSCTKATLTSPSSQIEWGLHAYNSRVLRTRSFPRGPGSRRELFRLHAPNRDHCVASPLIPAEDPVFPRPARSLVKD